MQPFIGRLRQSIGGDDLVALVRFTIERPISGGSRYDRSWPFSEVPNVRSYFGKPAKELTLPHVAFIVALINKPALPDRSFATDPLVSTDRSSPRSRRQATDAGRPTGPAHPRD